MDAIKKDRNSGLILTVFGSVLFLIFFNSLISAFKYNNPSKSVENVIVWIGVFLPWLILSFSMARSGLRRQRLANHAEEYLLRMKKNEDGSVLYLDRLPVMDEHNSTTLWRNDRGKFERDFREMIRRGYLRDVAAVEGDYGVILINKPTKQWRKSIYLNNNEADSNNANAKTVSVAGLFLLWIFVMMLIILAATGEDNNFMVLILVLLILLVILRCLSVFMGSKHLRHANRYGQVMEESITGRIPLHIFAERTGLDVSVIKKDIEWLFNHGILQGCHLETNGEPLIILDDVVSGEAVFDACDCPKCLNTTQVRAGRVAKCHYCGRLLEAPIILSD